MNDTERKNTNNVINSYHCPNCGAPIDVSISKYSKYNCKYCGSVVDIYEQVNLAHKSITPDSLLDYAYQMLREANYSEAEKNFREVLKRDVTISSAYWGLFLVENRCMDDEYLYSSNVINNTLSKAKENNIKFISAENIFEYLANNANIKNSYIYSTKMEKSQYDNILFKMSNLVLLEYFDESLYKVKELLNKYENAGTKELEKEISFLLCELEKIEIDNRNDEVNSKKEEFIKLLEKRRQELAIIEKNKRIRTIAVAINFIINMLIVLLYFGALYKLPSTSSNDKLLIIDFTFIIADIIPTIIACDIYHYSRGKFIGIPFVISLVLLLFSTMPLYLGTEFIVTYVIYLLIYSFMSSLFNKKEKKKKQ